MLSEVPKQLREVKSIGSYFSGMGVASWREECSDVSKRSLPIPRVVTRREELSSRLNLLRNLTMGNKHLPTGWPALCSGSFSSFVTFIVIDVVITIKFIVKVGLTLVITEGGKGGIVIPFHAQILTNSRVTF